jgi:hypothetical protein
VTSVIIAVKFAIVPTADFEISSKTTAGNCNHVALLIDYQWIWRCCLEQHRLVSEKELKSTAEHI